MKIDWQSVKLSVLKYTAYIINTVIICAVVGFVAWWVLLTFKIIQS